MRTFASAAAALCAAFSFAAHAQEHAFAHAEPAGPAHEGAAHGEAAHEGHADHEASRWELRLSLEAPIVTHRTVDGASETSNVSQELEGSFNVMLSYLLVPHTLSLDFEVGEGVLLRSNAEETPKRAGTTVRVGSAWSPWHGVPVYVTVLLPVHLEPSPVQLGLRAGAGVDMHLTAGVKWFFEADVDFSLAGGEGAPGAFAQQSLTFATGVLFHL